MDTREILKFVFVIVALPWVLPFVKSLYRDLVQAFEEDGGLLGQPPTRAKLEEIRARKRKEPPKLVSEPLAHVKAAVEAGQRLPGQRLNDPGRDR